MDHNIILANDVRKRSNSKLELWRNTLEGSVELQWSPWNVLVVIVGMRRVILIGIIFKFDY